MVDIDSLSCAAAGAPRRGWRFFSFWGYGGGNPHLLNPFLESEKIKLMRGNPSHDHMTPTPLHQQTWGDPPLVPPYGPSLPVDFRLNAQSIKT